ncbi:hypothetical protein HN51_009438 [Arachis hypogaea]|uniref:uncharacterized protein n=1 Tax=Arachis hypogaea TaxID=3818 RepID=UPI003B21440D|nr:uncharacterized protein DS421_5g167080 [Arachis hypogaea]
MESPTYWTQEKHMQFLNTIEASFVRTMLQNSIHRRRFLRLDRHLPDAFDSTLNHRHRNPSCATKQNARSVGLAIIRRTKRSSLSFNSLEDQVVPQVGNEGEAALVIS